jgi:hypothetical protein
MVGTSGEGTPVGDVTVFVDDAVLGRLPPVCVKDGVVTDDRLTFSQDVSGGSGLGVAWLLLLAGPLGWVGLIVVSAFRGGGAMLSVTVPFSEAAYIRMKRAKGTRLQAELILVGAAVGAVLAVFLRTTDGRLLAVGLAVIAVGALLKVIVATVQLHRLTVRLSLDASRRWVTLSGVHPNFVDAVEHDRHDSDIRSSI